MKRLIILLLGFSSLVSNAEEFAKSIVCSDLKSVIEYVSSEFVEVPFWVGKDENSKYVLMVNTSTKTWTMIEYDDKVACIIGSGVQATAIRLRGKSA